ncbi:MAG TPA: hypothetical protein VH328_07710, partial [Burkholderiaceae bacterium]|nr:hypothetical protein [Burkholderiaceae bacterium]
ERGARDVRGVGEGDDARGGRDPGDTRERSAAVQASYAAASGSAAAAAAAAVATAANVRVAPPVEARSFSAPATPPVPPAVPSFDLPVGDLDTLAQSAGLQWVQSDASRVAQARDSIADASPPTHAPRERPARVVVDEGPLVLVETRKDLSKHKLPFDAPDTSDASHGSHESNSAADAVTSSAVALDEPEAPSGQGAYHAAEPPGSV